MATDTTHVPAAAATARTANIGGFSVARTLQRLLAPLASLKLTVALFVLAMFIVLAGTFAQWKMDVWDVIDGYFRVQPHELFSAEFPWVHPGALIVWIPTDVFFPPSFFPLTERPAIYDWLPNYIVFPRGWTIGLVMLANLLAAHAIRFKVQARRARLAWGVAIVALGCALLYAVVATTSTQEEVPEPSSLFAAWPSMRILWQLSMGTFVSLVLLGGCALLFRKRAGIVLLHAGVGLLMFNEFWVGTQHIESQITLSEGETADWVYDTRSLELAVTDTSPAGHDDVTVVPWPMILDSRQKFASNDLPFNMEIIEHYRNSAILKKTEAPAIAKQLADQGAGVHLFAMEMPAGTGTDSGGKVDQTSAYVKLTDRKTGQPLGTYLFSVGLNEQPIEIAGKKYDVALRFKRNYKPYSVHLIRGVKEDYPGTNTPKDYSSYVRLVDDTRDVERENVRIWMNNPLRFAGETFYQSGYHQDEQSGIISTTLSVVTNVGWMIPYMACMIVVIGMLAQFTLVLLRFISRTARAASAPPEPLPQSEGAKRRAALRAKRSAALGADWAGILVPIAVVLIFGGWLLSKARPETTAPGEMDIVGFGRLPVIYEGRAKPLDTLARNTLRVMSNKQSFTDAEQWLGAIVPQGMNAWVFEIHAPARLLLNHTEQIDQFLRSFKFAEPDQPPTWTLPGGWTLAEKPEPDQFSTIDLLPITPLRLNVRKVPWSAKDEKADARARLDIVNNWRKQVGDAPLTEKEFQEQSPPQDIAGLQVTLFEGFKDGPRTPAIRWLLDMASGAEVADYHHIIRIDNPEVLDTLGLKRRASNLFSVDDLRDKTAKFEKQVEQARADVNANKNSLTTYQRKLLEVDQRIRAYTLLKASFQTPRLPPLPTAEQFAQDPTAARAQLDQFRSILAGTIGTLKKMEPPLVIPVAPKQEESAGPSYAEWKPYAEALTLAYIEAELLGKRPDEPTRALTALFYAYRDGNKESFNQELAAYQQAIGAMHLDRANTPSARVLSDKLYFEAFFNHFEPLWHSAAVYVVVAVLAALSLAVWRVPLGRAAFALAVFVLVIHTLGLLGRIYISGRPPVTNLYSSAVFIAWGGVVLGLVLEVFFRFGIGTLLAGCAGFMSLGIAHLLTTEVPAHRGDTFTVMQAVLDTQFWLATHVVCITLGYAATFVAGILGVSYILLGVLTPRLNEEVSATRMPLGKTLARIIYGVVCAATLLSFFGTVLGGLWADDSWGRFWGWDPKENGALLIVLWNALILHARWGRMIDDRGLAVLAVVGNIITAWSWFGVNELNLGLHSYGTTEGVLLALMFFVGSQLALIAVGLLPLRWWGSSTEGPDGGPPTELA